MTQREPGLLWLAETHHVTEGAIHVSKNYKPEESGTKSRVWWFEIPIQTINSNSITHIHLVCQSFIDPNKFLYLKIPRFYFLQNLSNLSLRENNKISMFLSSDSKNLFTDLRSSSRVSFKKYLIEA